MHSEPRGREREVFAHGYLHAQLSCLYDGCNDWMNEIPAVEWRHLVNWSCTRRSEINQTVYLIVHSSSFNSTTSHSNLYIRISIDQPRQSWTKEYPAHTSTNRLRPYQHPYLATMGKSQSKLSQEELADLQKNTYCMYLHFCVTDIECWWVVDKKELQQWVSTWWDTIRG